MTLDVAEVGLGRVEPSGCGLVCSFEWREAPSQGVEWLSPTRLGGRRAKVVLCRVQRSVAAMAQGTTFRFRWYQFGRQSGSVNLCCDSARLRGVHTVGTTSSFFLEESKYIYIKGNPDIVAVQRNQKNRKKIAGVLRGLFCFSGNARVYWGIQRKEETRECRGVPAKFFRFFWYCAYARKCGFAVLLRSVAILSVEQKWFRKWFASGSRARDGRSPSVGWPGGVDGWFGVGPLEGRT